LGDIVCKTLSKVFAVRS